MGQIKVAILDSQKMILPKYAKRGGIYGIFTSEGFVSADMSEGGDVEIESIAYDQVLWMDANVYAELSFSEY